LYKGAMPANTSITLLNSTKGIAAQAFYGCTSLISVTIPNGVTSIGNSAFKGCAKLTGVTIPASVTSIGASAFEGCFVDCTGLISVTFGGMINSYNFSPSTPFPGDLRDKFYATDSTFGTSGTYITVAPVNSNSVWYKQ